MPKAWRGGTELPRTPCWLLPVAASWWSQPKPWHFRHRPPAVAYFAAAECCLCKGHSAFFPGILEHAFSTTWLIWSQRFLLEPGGKLGAIPWQCDGILPFPLICYVCPEEGTAIFEFSSKGQGRNSLLLMQSAVINISPEPVGQTGRSSKPMLRGPTPWKWLLVARFVQR